MVIKRRLTSVIRGDSNKYSVTKSSTERWEITRPQIVDFWRVVLVNVAENTTQFEFSHRDLARCFDFIEEQLNKE